jgi:transposase-like protein
MHASRLAFGYILTLGALLSTVEARGDEAAQSDSAVFDAASLEFFEAEVRPLLVKRCFECHGGAAKEPKGGLRLDSRRGVLNGGDTGPAVVPGMPADSLLVDAISYVGLYEMPPKTKLPDGEIRVLKRWVELGLPWTPVEIVEQHREASFDLAARKASHWCWQPVASPAPPAVKNAAWLQQDWDAFVLARLEDAGILPASPADRGVLIRRAHFDLLGLPPTAADVEQFIHDPSAKAFEKLVDRLLESPHFGERWARHWMDLFRYAETYGHEFDYPIPHAYKYRDYLIRAFNADVPYDQLIREFVAGDLISNQRRHPETGANESVIGTGGWWLGEATHAPVDVRGDEAGRIDNQIDVLSKSFLGLTVACARCHDHKFDAIATQDYYGLVGFLQSSRRHEQMLDPNRTIQTKIDRIKQLHAAGSAALLTGIVEGSENSGPRVARYLAAVATTRDTQNAPDFSIASVAESHGVDTAQLTRWMSALEDADLYDTSHPLHAWNKLVSAAQFGASNVKQLADDFEKAVREATETNSNLPMVADFRTDFQEWMTIGMAFDQAASRAGQWDWQSASAQLRWPGVADSGVFGAKAQGVLYSPTFTLERPNVFFKLRGADTEIRLVVDGYFMGGYNALLFRGFDIDVKTDDKTVWHRQADDVSRYVGHRVHLEIIDHGDGFVAVEEIRLSDGSEPRAAPSRLGQKLVADQDFDSAQQLAQGYGRIWDEALRALEEGTADREQTEFVNWALRHELLLDGSAKQRLAELRGQIEELTASLPSPERILGLADGSGENERVFIRGNHRTLGDEAPRQLLVALVGDQPPVKTGSGRTRLADHIADPANPLTSRVIVNRLWHHLFGRGIVASVDNFGVLGQPPTHPQLLDFLAARFVDEGWSIKRMLREMMLSSSYQMSSVPRPDVEQQDPQNALLHRMRLRRMQGEVLRDTILTISGRLDATLYGPSVAAHITPFMQGRGRPKTSGPSDGDGRRSLYLEVRRNFLSPMMLAYDTPIPFNSMGRRNVSNVPAQALILMNDPFVADQALLWARRVISDASSREGRLRQMYLAAFARPPTESEQIAAFEFMDSQAKLLDLAPHEAADNEQVWADLGHVLWNVKEFVFVR